MLREVKEVWLCIIDVDEYWSRAEWDSKTTRVKMKSWKIWLVKCFSAMSQVWLSMACSRWSSHGTLADIGAAEARSCFLQDLLQDVRRQCQAEAQRCQPWFELPKHLVTVFTNKLTSYCWIMIVHQGSGEWSFKSQGNSQCLSCLVFDYIRWSKTLEKCRVSRFSVVQTYKILQAFWAFCLGWYPFPSRHPTCPSEATRGSVAPPILCRCWEGFWSVMLPDLTNGHEKGGPQF